MHLVRQLIGINYSQSDEPWNRTITRELERHGRPVFTIWTNSFTDMSAIQPDVRDWLRPASPCSAARSSELRTSRSTTPSSRTRCDQQRPVRPDPEDAVALAADGTAVRCRAASRPTIDVDEVPHRPRALRRRGVPGDAQGPDATDGDAARDGCAHAPLQRKS